MKLRVDIPVEGAHDVEEAARLLQVGVATVWRWIRERKISSFKLADRTCIPASAIEELQMRKSSPGHEGSSQQKKVVGVK